MEALTQQNYTNMALSTPFYTTKTAILEGYVMANCVSVAAYSFHKISLLTPLFTATLHFLWAYRNPYPKNAAFFADVVVQEGLLSNPLQRLFSGRADYYVEF